VVEAHVLHFGKKSDHFGHEVPHSALIVRLNLSIVDFLDFLFQCPVAEFHDNPDLIKTWLFEGSLFPEIIVIDLK
jgi:hypothetical protein